MGISIFQAESSKVRRQMRRFPVGTILQLTCDMPVHSFGLFADQRPTLILKPAPRGYVQQYSEAMRLGWKETTRLGARSFQCPECSRKPVMR